MGVCLLSAYINTFLAAVCGADVLAATVEIAPVVEEIMKLLPLAFYLLVFEPKGDRIKSAAYYADAVLWAVKENITRGTTNTTFSPDADCTRAQIVTFLWRCKK